MKRTAFLVLAFLAVALLPDSDAAQSDLYVVLARHAEKEAGDDPDLTAAGRARAAALAHALTQWPIEAVFVSQFTRTQATARPLERQFGIEATVVDAQDVDGLAARIRAEGRRAVAIVGHSNTVPAIIRALGVAEVREIPEHQYDDLFVVRLSADGGAHLLHFKYGAPSPGG